jgi:lipase maturation factor 1
VLDDAVLVRLRLRRSAGEMPTDSRARRAFVLVAFPLFLGLSLLSMVRELAFTVPEGRGLRRWPRWADETMELVAPLRSINGYGLFRVMTIQRPELILEGSVDGRQWREYDFRYKPGPVDERPRFVAPFHPRLDWQLWFAALAPARSLGWLEPLAERLRSGTPEVLGLLGRNPFPGTPPRYLRAVLYDYRFSTLEERRRTGAWWVRQRAGEIPLGE